MVLSGAAGARQPARFTAERDPGRTLRERCADNIIQFCGETSQLLKLLKLQALLRTDCPFVQ